MLSSDLRAQLKELKPFSQAIRVIQKEQNGIAIMVPHSNPAKRAKDELRKSKQDLDDLTLLAKQLDIDKKHIDLFSHNSILSFIDAVLDISEKNRRITKISGREQQIIDEYHVRWLKEAQTPFEKGKITEKERELERKEIFGPRDLLLAPLQDAFGHEHIPDPRRAELASRMAQVCLDYCASQLTLVEPDRVNVDLYQKPLDHAKELTDSIAGKVKRFQLPSKAKERKVKAATTTARRTRKAPKNAKIQKP